jgi:hypothetical protein
MSRSIHRRDSTHTYILQSIREAGFTCLPTATYGGFFGDIVVAIDGSNIILEVKPEGWTRPRNDREREQAVRRERWRSAGGQVEVVRTPFEALHYIKFGLGPGLE